MLGSYPDRLVVGHAPGSLNSHLQRGIAIRLDHPFGVFASLLGGRSAGTLVGADLISHASTEQGPHWNTRGFASYVPQGVFDPAHGGVCNNAAWKPRGVVHDVEEILHI